MELHTCERQNCTVYKHKWTLVPFSTSIVNHIVVQYVVIYHVTVVCYKWQWDIDKIPVTQVNEWDHHNRVTCDTTEGFERSIRNVWITTDDHIVWTTTICFKLFTKTRTMYDQFYTGEFFAVILLRRHLRLLESAQDTTWTIRRNDIVQVKL